MARVGGGAVLGGGVALLGVAAGVQAETMTLFSPDATPRGPNHYQVMAGQTFTITVSLSDLLGGLGYLGADINFDHTHFRSPVGGVVTADAIVPSSAGFAGGAFGSAGVTGSYDQLRIVPTGPLLTSNGEFFSFQLQALTLGSGTISFNDAAGSDAAGNLIFPTLGNTLQIDVVPLPAAVWSGLALLTLLGGLSVGRKLVLPTCGSEG